MDAHNKKLDCQFEVEKSTASTVADHSEYSGGMESDAPSCDVDKSPESYNEQLRLKLEIEKTRAKTEEMRYKTAKVEGRNETRRKRSIEKDKRRERNRKAADRFKIATERLPALSRSGWLFLLAIVVFAAFAAVYGVDRAVNNVTPTETDISTQLEKMVNISDLTTARVVYNGVAEKVDDNGDVVCHVYYEATIDVSINLKDIIFKEDKRNKKIYPIIPELVLGRPIVDSSSIDFFEEKPDISLSEVIAICEEDALSEIGSASGIFATAEGNLQLTVEALTQPLISRQGYSIEWSMPNVSEGGTDVNE